MKANHLRCSPQDYQLLHSLYIKYEFPKTRALTNSISLLSPYARYYPLRKIIRAAAKVLLLNILELTFFQQILAQSHWSLNDQLIRKHAKKMRCLVIQSDLNNPQQYRALNLYIFLVGFTVKRILNRKNEIECEANKYFPQIGKLCKAWLLQFDEGLLNINPNLINATHQADNKDYDKLVDELLLISPPYNPDKSFNYELYHQPQELQPSVPTAQIHLDLSRYSLQSSIKSIPSLYNIKFVGEDRQDDPSEEWEDQYLMIGERLAESDAQDQDCQSSGLGESSLHPLKASDLLH